MEPLSAAALVAGAGMHSIMNYNRENFFFDNEQNQKRQYQGQEMRVTQFDLYRDDVRCLVELTCQKMDIYITVTALLLGFLITMFCEGRLDAETPHYILWLYPLHLAGSFMYYLISLWLAVHASISAHAAGVRLLTQKVRLPVPTTTELNATRGFAKEFEQMKMADIFRVPVFSKTLRAQNNVMNAGVEEEATAEEKATPAIAKVKHILEYRKLQANWQSYDAYARVSMAIGTNQLLFALGYYSIGYQFSQDNNPYTALAALFGFSVLAMLIARLDLYSSERTTFGVGIFILLGPLLTLLSTVLLYCDEQTPVRNAVYRVLIPCVYLVHGFWILVVMFIASPDRLGGACLPTRFRAVLYLDVFGWLDADRRRGRSRGTSGLGGSSPSRSMAPPAPGAREAFCQNLVALEQQLKREFRLWQRREVATIIEGSPLTSQHQELYMKFMMESQRLHALPEIADAPRAATPRADPRPLFLKLELDLNGYETQMLFFSEDTDEILWDQRELPKNAQVCGIDELEEQIERLCSGITMMTQMGTASSFGRPRSDSASSVSHVSLIGGTQFSARQGMRKPGQIPWRTFCQGTATLFVIWVIGFIWCICDLVIFQNDLPLRPGKKEGLTFTPGEQVLSGPWHQFFTPHNLACHPSFRSLLVAERYDVHTLSPDGRKVSNSVLEHCLEEHPAFVARGISSVSISCSSVDPKNNTFTSQCWALLLRSDGSHILQCPLETALSKDAVNGSSSELVAPAGQSWNAVAAGADGAAEFWALANEAGTPGAVTSFLHERTTGETSKKLVRPQYELTIPQVANLKHLQVLGESSLWGLTADGRQLLQYDLGDGNPTFWQLPKNGWTGFCTTGTHIYSLIQNSFDPPAADWAIWRTQMDSLR